MILPSPRLVRRVFWPYAAVIFVATHWPRLEIHAPIERPDLILHVGVFALWTVLCALCGFFGPALSMRNIALAGGVGLVYSFADEALQAVPFLHRHAALDDALANALGVALAAAVLVIVSFIASRRPTP